MNYFKFMLLTGFILLGVWRKIYREVVAVKKICEHNHRTVDNVWQMMHIKTLNEGLINDQIDVSVFPLDDMESLQEVEIKLTDTHYKRCLVCNLTIYVSDWWVKFEKNLKLLG